MYLSFQERKSSLLGNKEESVNQHTVVINRSDHCCVDVTSHQGVIGVRGPCWRSGENPVILMGSEMRDALRVRILKGVNLTAPGVGGINHLFARKG